MTDLQEKAMRMALERLESHEYWMDEEAIKALRQALAQPSDSVEQEPVAVWELEEDGCNTIADPDWMETLPVGTRLYTAPPKQPVKSYCGGKPNYCTPEVTPDVDGVNISAELVDETAKREHEPFIYVREDNEKPFGGYEHCSEVDAGAFPVYTAPPHHDSDVKKREWVGLTDEEIIECFDTVAFGEVEDDLIINKHVNIFTAIRTIEAKLKEKNGGTSS